jgi:hypothetical protein
VVCDNPCAFEPLKTLPKGEGKREKLFRQGAEMLDDCHSYRLRLGLSKVARRGICVILIMRIHTIT